MDVVQKRKHQPIENTVNMQLNCLIGGEHFQYVALINEKGAVAALTRMFFIIFRIIPPMRRRGT